MKRLLSGFLLSLAILGPALAVNPATRVGDAAYTILPTDVRVYSQTAFTAGRTWTLPSAGGTCVGQTCQPAAYQLEINDVAGAFSQAFPLTITPASGETINGNTGNLVISGAYARVLLFPTSGSNWVYTTDGDYITTGLCKAPAAAATVTITTATPAVITFTAHGMTGACPIVFTNSGGALPTGITSGTVYYISPGSITTNTFSISTTVANALAGTLVATTVAGTGTQTGTPGVALSTTTAADVTGLTLSQGEWDCRSKTSRTLAASTSVTVLKASHSTTSATSGTQGSLAASWLQTAANVMGVLGQDSSIGPDRVATTANTNLFLVAQDTFTVSTNVAYGAVTCRRAR